MPELGNEVSQGELFELESGPVQEELFGTEAFGTKPQSIDYETAAMWATPLG